MNDTGAFSRVVWCVKCWNICILYSSGSRFSEVLTTSTQSSALSKTITWGSAFELSYSDRPKWQWWVQTIADCRWTCGPSQLAFSTISTVAWLWLVSPGPALTVSPPFFPEKTGDFFYSLLSLLLISLRCHPLDGVITHLFTCPTSFVHYFIVNSATIFFRSGVIPREGVTRDGSPPSRPPQWRHWIGSCFTVIRRTRFMFAVMLMADGPSFLYKKLLRETWHKKLVYKSHTEPPKFLVRETWTMTEMIKNFKFYFFSG